MPTGYTAAIKDSISFEQFAMNCARAMGACVMMREEPFDAPVPERFEPSTYHAEKLAEAEKNLAWYQNMADSEVDRERLKEFGTELAAYRKRIKDADELRVKYEAMLRDVEAWAPPTCDHTGFKAFMLQQLNDSIKFDCDTSYDSEPEIYSTNGWRDIKIMKARRDIEYHTKGHREEVERTEQRNTWLRELRESLKAA